MNAFFSDKLFVIRELNALFLLNQNLNSLWRDLRRVASKKLLAAMSLTSVVSCCLVIVDIAFASLLSGLLERLLSPELISTHFHPMGYLGLPLDMRGILVGIMSVCILRAALCTVNNILIGATESSVTAHLREKMIRCKHL